MDARPDPALRSTAAGTPEGGGPRRGRPEGHPLGHLWMHGLTRRSARRRLEHPGDGGQRREAVPTRMGPEGRFDFSPPPCPAFPPATPPIDASGIPHGAPTGPREGGQRTAGARTVRPGLLIADERSLVARAVGAARGASPRTSMDARPDPALRSTAAGASRGRWTATGGCADSHGSRGALRLLPAALPGLSPGHSPHRCLRDTPRGADGATGRWTEDRGGADSEAWAPDCRREVARSASRRGIPSDIHGCTA